MNRRDFLASLGLGSAALLIDPSLLLPKLPVVEASAKYPKLSFTGFKASMTQPVFAGQFLWAVSWKGVDGSSATTPWFCNVVLSAEDIRLGGRLIQHHIQTAFLAVVHMVDGIVDDAQNGIVQTGCYHQVPNPDFDPALPVTTPWDDEYEVWNPRTVNGPPVMEQIQSMEFVPWCDEIQLPFNMDQAVAEITQRFL